VALLDGTVTYQASGHCKWGVDVWVVGAGGTLMRGFAGLLAYLVGVSAIISIGIVCLMALQSTTVPTVAASHKERIAKPAKRAILGQKKVRSNRKKKIVHVIPRPRHDAPTTDEVSYGYAEKPRRRPGDIPAAAIAASPLD